MTGIRYGVYTRWLPVSIRLMFIRIGLAVTREGCDARSKRIWRRDITCIQCLFPKVVQRRRRVPQACASRAKTRRPDRLDWPAGETFSPQRRFGPKLTMDEFVDPDDISVMHCFKI